MPACVGSIKYGEGVTDRIAFIVAYMTITAYRSVYGLPRGLSDDGCSMNRFDGSKFIV